MTFHPSIRPYWYYFSGTEPIYTGLCTVLLILSYVLTLHMHEVATVQLLIVTHLLMGAPANGGITREKK